MELINYTLQNNITYSLAKVETQSDTFRLSLNTDLYVDNEERYITKHCSEIVSQSYDKVLVGGLGLGMIPYYIKQVNSAADITVVETNQDVIQIMNDLNYLPNDIEIVHENFLTYSPTESYDLIISDIHWGHPILEPTWEQEIEDIKSRYSSSLSPGGTLYIPLVKYKNTLD